MHSYERRIRKLLWQARSLGTFCAVCAIVGTSLGFLPFLLGLGLLVKIVLSILAAGLLVTSVGLYRLATMGVAILLADIIRNMNAADAHRLLRALREKLPPLDPEDRP